MKDVRKHDGYLDNLLERIDRDRDVLFQEESEEERVIQTINLVDKMREAIGHLYSLWQKG